MRTPLEMQTDRKIMTRHAHRTQSVFTLLGEVMQTTDASETPSAIKPAQNKYEHKK